MKKQKINLKRLNVQSFITEDKAIPVNGGVTGNACSAEIACTFYGCLTDRTRCCD